MNIDNRATREIGNIMRAFIKIAEISDDSEDEYISFLSFCSDRINRGDSVRAIYLDFPESTG